MHGDMMLGPGQCCHRHDVGWAAKFLGVTLNLMWGQPNMMAAVDITAGGQMSDGAAAAAASDLLLLAASIRFLEFSAPAAGTNGSRTTEAHPALHIMQQAYPVIAALLEAPAWRSRAEVVDAACEAYRRTLLSVKARSASPSPRLKHHMFGLMCVFTRTEPSGWI